MTQQHETTVLGYVSELLQEAKQQQLETGDGFSIGGVHFAVSETAPCIQPMAGAHFQKTPGAGPLPSTRICCLYGPRPLYPDLQIAVSELWFQHIVTALDRAGLYGFYEAETQRWEVFDPVLNIGVRTLPDAADYPAWEGSAPFANLVHWMMRAHGKCMVHAAAIGKHGKGALLIGEGGSGKSSTTIAAALSGFQTVGDDYVILQQGADDRISAVPFSKRAKQSAEGLLRLGISESEPEFDGPNWQGKYEFEIDLLRPGSFVTETPIDFVFLPRIAHSGITRLSLVSKSEAFRGLTESTMKQLVGDRAGMFAFCAKTIRTLPCYALELGTDPVEICDVISGFLMGSDT